MRPGRFSAALLVALACPPPAAAQERVVTSAAPEAIALTVYRAPYGDGAIDLRWLDGFALVTETRHVRLPRGPATLRFEGVAEGIVPVSAVIDGLPGGVVEKNRDARLLSPASLVDGTLGRQVTLTRTDPATGRKVSEQARIVAGPRPGVILQTASGIEALRCSGLPEQLTYADIPAGLSAKPVLSVATVSPQPRTATVRLSYLTSNFDWRASYVATVAPDGRTLDLFAWLTLANGNPEPFPTAQVSAVTGRLNRVGTPRFQQAAGALSLSCYPLGTTSDIPKKVFEPAEEIVVTGARMMAMAVAAPAPPPPPPPEDLGDLKLYRVPERVTVSARGQKQVALLARTGVPFERRYRFTVAAGGTFAPSPTAVVLAMRNRKDAQLGLPLPAGSTATYAARPDGDRLLLGTGKLSDRAEGERFRIAAGTSTQVLVEQASAAPKEATIRVTNATPSAATLDIPIGRAGQTIEADGKPLEQVDGIATWSPTVPPGGSAELRYRF
ncbi:DUF4139 domain-containing protein [Sphingomonas sp. ac-8]|uniref:DUF4139 domain-containing protein n=1 Tax=Sphingomonas sp. ac-8 TaxID=3242977 RepID=UPI003A809341